jgi:hypothetical protein
LGPLGSGAISRPIIPASGDYDDGEIGGMFGRGNLSTRIKPAPVSLCPPQNPHAARMRTHTAAVGKPCPLLKHLGTDNIENAALLMLRSCLDEGTCLHSRCREKALVYLPPSRSSLSNGSTLHNM